MADITALVGVSDASSLGALLPAFKVVQQMTDTYQQVKLGRKRCKAVIQQAGLIIKEVYGDLQRDQNSMPDVTKFQSKLEEVQIILQRIADLSFFKALLHFEDINKNIERAYSHLAECSTLFPAINLPSRAQAQSKAAISDREVLKVLLRHLTGNYEEIRRRLGICSKEQEDQAMAVMERELRNARAASEEDMPVEMQIMQKSLECIKTTTGRSAPKQKKWLITEYDLEHRGIIGGGGSATVTKAIFRYTTVAVKTFKDAGNMREVLEREVEIWSRLHHDHIVPFYGASTLTSPPFIVSRYMQNGNLVQYLARTPNADRIKLLFEVSLGMYYLHEEDIVHGDLKGVNVLIDDARKACITDFGLSKIRTPEMRGTKTSKVAGTLRFLAPEALMGEPLSFETDVYAFGMLIYEAFAGEVPFIREPDDAVTKGHLELLRPISDRVYEYGFSDEIWQFLSDCISRKPSARPRFKAIQATLYSLKKPEPSAQSADPDAILGDAGRITDWRLETEPTTYSPPILHDSAAPLLRTRGSILGGQHSILSRSVSYDSSTSPLIFPVCIEVTQKYFRVKFSIYSREPGVYLEESNTSHWQPIRAKKGSLSREEANKFWYKSATGQGDNSWEWDDNDVTLRTPVNTSICRFRDSGTALKWFVLQSSYARDESVCGWATAMGDWFHTEQSWRRIRSGRLQQASLVDRATDVVPPDDAWKDIGLPKRCVIDGYAGTDDHIACIANPGRQPGRFCCKLDGRKIVFETYRRRGDEEPMVVRDETYPSDEHARRTFLILRSALEGAAEKSSRSTLFSF